ncbi:MAG: radical SAM family heme chaperone HemW [Ignavibacteria bacterium]|nr:radical SAM family heme chaperone HemW [Ignavibacteria bacterium]
MQNSALYIHVPFCAHKCIYCDFYSIITPGKENDFIAVLEQEIQYYSVLYGKSHHFDTIFFGGGTPSLLTPAQIERILTSLHSAFSISSQPEITLESNPGTLSNEKLRGFRAAGVNRLSIGIQSFQERDLEFLTRIHSAEQAGTAVLEATRAGFDNINIDLIFNLPGQTSDLWLENLETAVNLPVNHISAYSLILEHGTILNKLVLDGKVTMQDTDYDADLYEITIEYLARHGYTQYEVSNFCKPGFECKHNNHYWHYDDYLSFGPSAHSFVHNTRWHNYTALSQYHAAILRVGHAQAGSEKITPAMAAEEYIMLALRSNGLDTHIFSQKFGAELLNTNKALFSQLLHEGFISKQGDILRLTPKGYAVCDEILERLQ